MCGVVGVYNSNQASFEVMLGLFATQNRGQESCGIAVSNQKKIVNYRGMGLVKEVLNDDIVASLQGQHAIGHVRYPTRGTCNVGNTQPYMLETLAGTLFALASNGDITNYPTLSKKLEDLGVGFQSGNDGELLLRYISYYHLIKGVPVHEAIAMMMREAKGAFSTLLLGKDEIWAFRDPYGVRPLSYGKTETGYAFASESKGLDIIRATDIVEVMPGEIIHVKGDKLTRYTQDLNQLREGRKSCAHCVFELVYFAMPDSKQFGHAVYDRRKVMGQKLAEYDKDLDADIVFAAPDSSNIQALGYAQFKKIPFELALIRNHYVGRTFIKPSQEARDEAVKQKFNPIRAVIQGKKVVLVDDSIVRGTTMRKLVGMIKDAGAKEVHLRIASPMVKYPCFYGLDTNSREELIANKMSLEELAKYLMVDSLKFLEQQDLSDAVENNQDKFCFACFDGNYPIPLIDVGY